MLDVDKLLKGPEPHPFKDRLKKTESSDDRSISSVIIELIETVKKLRSSKSLTSAADLFFAFVPPEQFAPDYVDPVLESYFGQAKNTESQKGDA